MDVQALRGYVREHLDVDTEELPDTLLNIYLQDAFDVTMSYSNQWPRNERYWDLTKAVDATAALIPADINQPSIMSVTHEGRPLVQMDASEAEATFYGAPIDGQVPYYYSIWEGAMYFWPTPTVSDEFTVTVRGYRQPVWDNAASSIPDLDLRLHIALAYYAMSLAYGQQEDEVLEAVWLARWERTLNMHAKAILAPRRSRPIILHGGRSALPYNSFSVNLP